MEMIMMNVKPHQLQHLLDGQRRIKECCERAKKELNDEFSRNTCIVMKSEFAMLNYLLAPPATFHTS